MKRYLLICIAAVWMMTLSACSSFNGTVETRIELSSNTQSESSEIDSSVILTEDKVDDASDSSNVEEGKQEVNKITIAVNGKDFTATLEDNEAARELAELLRKDDITLNLSDYSGFEKVGSLGYNLTTSNAQTTTKAGDIVLYNGNQIVIFYGSNSWSYTYLAHIDDLSGWEEALGSGDVIAVLSID